MKRIGAICRMDATGLGIQSKEFFDHIPCKALVIDFSGISNFSKQYKDWYPNQTFYKIKKIGYGVIDENVLLEFIKDIDVIFCFENPYDYKIFDLCKQRGIKTILQLNYEFLEYPCGMTAPDLFAAPSMWHYKDIPDNKVYLPVPVNLEKFKPVKKEKTFLHIAGKKTIHDRNGTIALLRSLQFIKNEVTVIIRSQHKIDVSSFVIPDNVKLVLDFENKDYYEDNYTGGVLVMPRQYGGLSLVFNEALASGMPVITTDISPNNFWLPKEWLVTSKNILSFHCKKEIDVYEVDFTKLAEKIDEFCNEEFYNKSLDCVSELRESISWQTLMPLYKKILND